MSLKLDAIYVITLVLLVFSTDIYMDFLCESGESCPIYDPVSYLALGVFLFFSAIGFFQFSGYLKVWFLVLTAYVLFLMFESLYHYNSLFQYPHVFMKPMIVYFMFGSYAYFKKLGRRINLKTFFYIVIVSFLVNIIILNRDFYTISAFTDVERGLSADTTLVLLLPALFFFNRFFESHEKKYFFFFLVLLGFIVFLQHRTVWMTTLIALFLNMLFLKSKSKFSLNLSVVGVSAFLVTLLLLFTAVTIVEFVPKFADTFVHRAYDIIDPAREGTTSAWRLLQFESYWPFIQEHMLFGMRLEGFELPIQFYHPEAGIPFFEDGTGHHFHSYYIDVLFYEGIFGFFLFLVPGLIYLLKLIKRNKSLTAHQLFLSVFCLSGFVYALSYNLPVFFYGFFGITLFYLEKTLDEQPVERQELKKEQEELQLS